MGELGYKQKKGYRLLPTIEQELIFILQCWTEISLGVISEA